MKCPLIKEECLEDECRLWVKLTAGEEEHGRCAVAWLPILLVELKEVIARKESPCTAENSAKK